MKGSDIMKRIFDYIMIRLDDSGIPLKRVLKDIYIPDKDLYIFQANNVFKDEAIFEDAQDSSKKRKISFSNVAFKIKRQIERKAITRYGFDFVLSVPEYLQVRKTADDEFKSLQAYYDTEKYKFLIYCKPFPSVLGTEYVTEIENELRDQCGHLVLDTYYNYKKSVVGPKNAIEVINTYKEELFQNQYSKDEKSFIAQKVYDEIENEYNVIREDLENTAFYYYYKVRYTLGENNINDGIKGLTRISPVVRLGVESMIKKAQYFFDITTDQEIKGAIEKLEECRNWVIEDEKIRKTLKIK